MAERPTEQPGGAPSGPDQLARVVGVPGAVFMGLGSIIGTGIFVSVGIAAGVAGNAVIVAVALAALVATFNGLSSAQLAASHPVSGGTYEYGYRFLNPTAGFVAGWMFLCAKSASAATAALGFAGYVLTPLGKTATSDRIIVGLIIVVALTAVIASGMRRSNLLNIVIVSITLLALAAFVVAGIPTAIEGGSDQFRPLLPDDGGGIEALLHGTALMFVAYTGYGRIATLGEEVRNPRKTIPRAVITALWATMLLYVAVVAVAIGTVGAAGLAEATRSAAAPLEVVARELDLPAITWIVAGAAITAMVGVLLNLLLGLSRVFLAMARRRDMPAILARVGANSSPTAAVLATGALIAGLVMLGSVKTTWSFSAFTVLIYYALTNAAALRLPPELRRYPRIVPALGLLSCLGLAFWVEPRIWAAGLGVIALGLVWHAVARRLRASD